MYGYLGRKANIKEHLIPVFAIDMGNTGTLTQFLKPGCCYLNSPTMMMTIGFVAQPTHPRICYRSKLNSFVS